MHADHCRVQKRTVNQWLAEPGAMPAFLLALQAQGWIRRGEEPANSRWWALIDGPSAPMYGVFTAYEKQLWHDWIAAGWQARGRRVLLAAGRCMCNWMMRLRFLPRTPISRP